jgi:hypothetical protein
MRIKNKKYIHVLFALGGLFSLFLLLAGKWDTAGALWVVMFSLLPALWVALSTSYLSLKIFCATALITQFITVPVFFLQADRYTFDNHRPFSFTTMETLPVFLILGMFLWLAASVVKISQSVIGKPVQWTDSSTHFYTASSVKHKPIFVIGIILLMAFSLPVKFWMFTMGIGIVGVSPPQLPFRLSGILVYTFGYIVPIGIGYLYHKTNRSSLLLSSLIAVYALLIGISSSSKGVVLLTTAPIIAFALLDRRWTILGVSGLLAGFGVILTSASREIVHISDGLTTGFFTNLGTIGTLAETLATLEWSPEMLLFFVDISKRVEGFQGLLLASRFNPDSVGGAWALFSKSIVGSWADLGHDAMHLEYLGYTIPYGFYNIAASLNAWMLMAANQNVLMVFPFVIYVALTLVILEKMLMRAAHKYRLPPQLAKVVLLLATLWFYTGPGTPEFIMLFTVSIIFGLLPALRLGHTSRPARIAME